MVRTAAMKASLPVLAWAAALVEPVVSQFPPTPEGVKVIESKFNERITISYKEVRCNLVRMDSTELQLTPCSLNSARPHRA